MINENFKPGLPQNMLNPSQKVNGIENPEVKPENGGKVNRRLMISNVILENFKSYYGKLEIGPLHKCFTAVVGPNGSGKSNLIESLLFVFGKKAKQMRL